jgi:hypothetical protein
MTGGYHLPRMNMRQVLENTRDHSVMFHAVILDASSGKRVASVPIYKAAPGEFVDLSIKTETLSAEVPK